MASLIELKLDLEKLKKEKYFKGKKGTYYTVTLSVSDDTNDWGQNVSAFDSLTKEERDAKVSKNFVGNGKVIWTDGKITKADIQENSSSSKKSKSILGEDDDLPF
jgi:hypothetical protein